MKIKFKILNILISIIEKFTKENEPVNSQEIEETKNNINKKPENDIYPLW